MSATPKKEPTITKTPYYSQETLSQYREKLLQRKYPKKEVIDYDRLGRPVLFSWEHYFNH